MSGLSRSLTRDEYEALEERQSHGLSDAQLAGIQQEFGRTLTPDEINYIQGRYMRLYIAIDSTYRGGNPNVGPELMAIYLAELGDEGRAILRETGAKELEGHQTIGEAYPELVTTH